MRKSDQGKTTSRKDKEISQLRERLVGVEKERNEYKDKWLRALADFENFRKQKEKDKQEARVYAQENILCDLLRIVDDFQRALQHMNEKNSLESLQQGVKMVYQELIDFLRQHQVECFSAKGEKFDPYRHEAIEMIEGEGSEEESEHVVAEEVLPGYTFQDRLLRPAQVKVKAEKEKKRRKK